MPGTPGYVKKDCLNILNNQIAFTENSAIQLESKFNVKTIVKMF